ncbi:hypothetical protein KPH14_011576 [Odynerus spinipes]|uniref:Uncharacterized protein n=1 Tax=Odynerus spinipes TaxID=1348599 RepID=A0AAD9RID0_9HYME|nr:hypothetical protein KPH14_011576 [Odynerus spinipes]
MKLVDKKDKSFSVSTPKRLNRNVSRRISTVSNKNIIGHKPLSNEETDIELTLINVSNLSVRYKEILLKKPIVILERIPLLDSLSNLLKTQDHQHSTSATSDVVRQVKKQLFKDLSSVKHLALYINKKYLKKTKRNILSTDFNNKKNQKLNSTNFIVSSTPETNLKSRLNDTSSLNLSPKTAISPIIDNTIYKNSPFTPISSANKKIENITVKDHVKNSSYVIEDEKILTADETYELLEPKTPHLQQRYRKHIMVDDADNKKEIKKVAKVRFTTPEYHVKRLQTSSHMELRKTPLAKFISPKRSSSASNTSAKKNISNFEFKGRCNSMSNINITRKNSKKRERTSSSLLEKTKVNIENQGKNGEKSQSAKKKIPNFTEIHKQMFNKMESLVDNKKRLIQQHEALRTPKVLRLDRNDSKQPTSIETRNKSYNKFGFKLKKDDAVNIVLRKQTNVQKKKREENKVFLKGVRTNRRFELQMKMRKLSD